LVEEQIEAAARFLARFDKYAPVRVAFWLKEAESPFWYFCIVSDEITGANFDLAYREVGRLARELRDPAFNVMRVKVFGIDTPMGQAAMNAQRPYPSKSPVVLRNRYFGGVEAAEIYIYPQPVTV